MLPKHIAFFFLLFLVGLVCLTTILVMRNADSYRAAALQEEYQARAKLRLLKETNSPITEKPTIMETRAHVNQILEKKKKILRHSTKPQHVITEESEGQIVESAITYDDSPTPITDGYFDENINSIPKHVDDVVTAKKNAVVNTIVLKADGSSTTTEAPKTLITLCRNTVIGNHFITDSKGYTCRIEDVDHVSRCCSTQPKPTTTRYSCKSCDNKYGCCSVYEHCVSCCMAPDRRQELRETFEKRRSDRLYKGVTTVFQFCAIRCRTTSRSVINENKYRSPMKHCYAHNDPADIALPMSTSP
jgi:hypothetical protein